MLVKSSYKELRPFQGFFNFTPLPLQVLLEEGHAVITERL